MAFNVREENIVIKHHNFGHEQITETIITLTVVELIIKYFSYLYMLIVDLEIYIM